MVALMTIGYTNSNAQAFQEGKSYASIGYGVGTISKSLYSIYETNTDFKYTEIGPIYAKYEYAVGEKFGIGVHIAYKSGLAKYAYTDGGNNYIQSINSNSLSIFGRFNWHFGDHDKFDPYLGIGVGYRNSSYKYTSTDPNYDPSDFTGLKNPFNFGGDLTFGTRYFFTDNIGAYVELGIAKSIFQLGLTAKF